MAKCSASMLKRQPIACICAIILAFASASDACSFAHLADADTRLAHSHLVARQSSGVPTIKPSDPTNTSFLTSTYGGITTNCQGLPICDQNGAKTILELLELVPKGAKQDYCYFSFQSLPPPNLTVANYNSYDFSSVASQLNNMFALADQAYSRLALQASPSCTSCGNVVWTAYTIGYAGARFACSNAIGSNLIDQQWKDRICNNSAVLNQTSPYPYASAVFRMTGNNTAALSNFVKIWRNSSAGHLPAISSDEVQKLGWGAAGGQLTAKNIPCAELPDFVKNGISFPIGDGLAKTSTGNLAFEDGLRFWSAKAGYTDSTSAARPRWSNHGVWVGVAVGVASALLLLM